SGDDEDAPDVVLTRGPGHDPVLLLGGRGGRPMAASGRGKAYAHQAAAYCPDLGLVRFSVDRRLPPPALLFSPARHFVACSMCHPAVVLTRTNENRDCVWEGRFSLSATTSSRPRTRATRPLISMLSSTALTLVTRSKASRFFRTSASLRPGCTRRRRAPSPVCRARAYVESSARISSAATRRPAASVTSRTFFC